ncbi:hypothetical protein [Paenibacillus sp. LHD-38]|uniref:hypothetical protein n=1 Tax=Paenibacillus sp. LHD-38 TaxID=3072143 RepID=UPI00280F9DE7|nr:hypothetical protein [Paenibacillus sp. LHD-38]MDQ8738468.1 hypothetical protein [Paenibacillus sp. LHD-38]
MFNKYPINPVRQPFSEQPISKGYEALTEQIMASLDEKAYSPVLIIVDGTHGAARTFSPSFGMPLPRSRSKAGA